MNNLIDDILANSFSTPEKAREFFENYKKSQVDDLVEAYREVGFWKEAFRMAVENRRLKHAKKELKKINKSLRKENERLSAGVVRYDPTTPIPDKFYCSDEGQAK